MYPCRYIPSINMESKLNLLYIFVSTYIYELNVTSA